MTAIFSKSIFISFGASTELRVFSVEVVTFDGESVKLEVEAANEDQACEQATAQVDNADYAMVQGVS